MSTTSAEVSASVYSLVTARKGEYITPYLYEHSTVVETQQSNRFNFFIVKTTAWDTFDSETQRALGSSRTPAGLIQEAFFLANYQLDRLSSGLFGGILAGSLREAQALLAETAVV